MNNKSVLLVVLGFLMIPVTIMLGQWSATDPAMAMAVGGGVIVLVVMLVMGRNAWLLIPLFYAFSSPVTALPGSFALRDIVTGIVFLFMGTRWLVSKYHLEFRFGSLELMLLIQYIFVVQVYIRNPAGFALFGSAMVGGRPYFEIAVSAVLFMMLSTQVVSFQNCSKASNFFIMGGLGAAFIEMLSVLIPGVGYRIAHFYRVSGVGQVVGALNAEAGLGKANQFSTGRRVYLFWLVKPLFTWLVSKSRPIHLLNPMRPLMVLGLIIVVAAALLSGFRSLIVWVGMMYLASAYVHRKGVDVLVAAGAGLLILAVLAGGNRQFFELPMSVQRALSFLPGEWDSLAKSEAEASNQWRFDMWETVLTSPEYIENKILGDGYGLSADDFSFQQTVQMAPVVSDEMMQEHFMRSGDYHSGPIQTINRVGYIGLFFLVIAFFVFTKYTLSLFRRSRGTPFFFSTLIVGLPMVVYPFFFTLIIGGHAQALMMFAFHGGMLRMIENSMDYEDQMAFENASEDSMSGQKAGQTAQGA